MAQSGIIKDWWTLQYADDIVNYLKEREIVSRERRPFLMRSPQLQLRNGIIDWLCDVGAKLRLSFVVVYKGIYFLDVFMDNHVIEPRELKFAAVGCLIVAAKAEEIDCNIPKFSKMEPFLDISYKLSEFCTLEENILYFLEWDFLNPCSIHFLEYFILFATSSKDIYEGKLVGNDTTVVHYVRDLVMDFLKTSMKDVTISFVYLPSVIAASCVCVTRYSLNLLPVWPDRLKQVTGIHYKALEECMTSMMNSYSAENEATLPLQPRKFQCVNSPDQGYYSSVPSSPTSNLVTAVSKTNLNS